MCAVSKHRTAAQEPRARRPDPHPIRSAPEGSRSTRVRCSHVSSSEFPKLSRWSNGVELLTYVIHTTVRSTLHSNCYIAAHTIFRSLRPSGPVSGLPRARLPHMLVATTCAQSSISSDVSATFARSVPPRHGGRGPAGTSRAARGRLFVRGRGSPDDLRRLRAPPAGAPGPADNCGRGA